MSESAPMANSVGALQTKNRGSIGADQSGRARLLRRTDGGPKGGEEIRGRRGGGTDRGDSLARGELCGAAVGADGWLDLLPPSKKPRCGSTFLSLQSRLARCETFIGHPERKIDCRSEPRFFVNRPIPVGKD